jgi:hypothetical protein
MPVNLNAGRFASVPLQRTLGVPEGGPKIVPIILDFSASSSYFLDYSNQMVMGFMDMVQTLWVDNFGNTQILKITIPASQQVLQIPAGTQGYFPCLCPNPVKIQFDSAGATVQQVTLMNFPVFP